MSLATGVSGDKLQWLVAAAEVGLGFGFKVFANSFLPIILFERPIRIGDTIVGNLHGISRIRIRATTDRLRPQRDHHSQQNVRDRPTINWSLSDNVTRVELPTASPTVRIYHSCIDCYVRLPMRTRVLDDPEPQVFCLSYGPHSLNFELRIFVNDLLDRLFAADEVNCRVDELFRGGSEDRL